MNKEINVGERIKRYLINNGIKTSFLIEKTGMKRATVYSICKGNRGVDCVEYYKICKALNVPFETFLY